MSPSASLSSWLPNAIRPSAARGSPCPPVATISTSLARQAHRLVEADRLGEIDADSRSPARPEDAVERAAGDAHLAAGFVRDAAERLEPRGVRGEGGDQHPALAPAATCVEQAVVDARLRSPTAVSWKTLVESQTSASTPSSPIARQRLGARRLAEHRRLVDLPVAGVEDRCRTASRSAAPLPSGIEWASGT